MLTEASMFSARSPRDPRAEGADGADGLNVVRLLSCRGLGLLAEPGDVVGEFVNVAGFGEHANRCVRDFVVG